MYDGYELQRARASPPGSQGQRGRKEGCGECASKPRVLSCVSLSSPEKKGNSFLAIRLKVCVCVCVASTAIN